MAQQSPNMSTITKDSSAAPSDYAKARVIAANIGVHPKSLFRWADAGHIARYKLNARIVLFSVKEVMAYIAASKI